MKIRCTTLVLLSVFISSTYVNAQFLHQEGKTLVDKDGKEIILRGMGLGGWMLQEGYMLGTADFAGSQHLIKAKFAELIGETSTEKVYDAWLKNHCTERDIDSLAAWGFNSVRLPMHYNLYTPAVEAEYVAGQNTWLEKGFAMTDSLLKWCAKNKMYLILDLHAAPGGQGNDANISDYDPNKPALWQSEANKQKTIELWKKLAERYKNEKWIGGYDLINEPNWNFTGSHKNGCDEESNGPLRDIYVELTKAIREIDKNHVIIIEGNCWGNNYSGMFPLWDKNMTVSFHKYWNFNDQSSLESILKIRDEQNVPVWLGESGENSNTWFTNAIALVESNKIGWAWWPMKKINSIVNPLTITKTNDYETLLNYWKNGGDKPSQEFATATLLAVAEGTNISKNVYHTDVIDAMFRQVNDKTAKHFKNHELPGIIHATDFDLGRNGVAYFDKDTANYHVSTNKRTPGNTGGAYRNDGVDIEKTNDRDPKGNGYNVGWTEDGEWQQYTVQLKRASKLSVKIRYANLGTIRFVVDGKEEKNIDLSATGGFDRWSTVTTTLPKLPPGTHKIKVLIVKGGVNLSYFDFAVQK